MVTKRKRDERRRVDARRNAEAKKEGFVRTTFRVPDGVKLYEFKHNKCIARWDILDYVVGEINNAQDAETGMLHYELTYLVHRGLGADQKQSLVCPRTGRNPKPCPVCEYSSQLRKQGAAWDDPVIKSLKPKIRQMFLFYDLDDMDSGLQLLDMSYYNFGKMLNDRLETSDEEDGFAYFSMHGDGGMSVRIAFEEKTFEKLKFPNAVTIDFKRRKKPYPDDLIDSFPCLDELLIIPPYDKLEKLLIEGEADDEDEEPERKPAKAPKAKAVDPEEDEDDEADEAPKPKPKSKTTKPQPAKVAAPASKKQEEEDEDDGWDDEDDWADAEDEDEDDEDDWGEEEDD